MAKLLTAGIFKAVAEIAITAKARRDSSHAEFLSFFRTLVEELPTGAAAIFGSMNGIAVIEDGKPDTWAIELTVTDYIWWKRHIEELGARIVANPASVQIKMLDRLSKFAEMQTLSPEERKALLAVLDNAA